MNMWLDRPESDKSVTLTILVIATSLYITAIIASSFGYVVNANMIENFWLGAAGLYVGRKLKFSRNDAEDDSEQSKNTPQPKDLLDAKTE